MVDTMHVPHVNILFQGKYPDRVPVIAEKAGGTVGFWHFSTSAEM